jgi:hypothetical protein
MNIDENICPIKMKALIHLFMSHMFVSVIHLFEHVIFGYTN